MADRRRRRPSESEGEEGEEETLSTSQASLGSTEEPSHSGEDERDRQSPCESEGEHAEVLSEYESAEEDRGEADEDSQAEQGDSDTEHEDTRADDDTETEDTQETSTGETHDLDLSKSTTSTGDSDKGKKVERQSGDGSEAPDSEDQAENENLDDDEDRRNPAFIPRKGDFFEHDIRGEEDEKQQGRPPIKGRRKLWQDEGKWQHDLFNEDEQRPKPVEELVAIYGYDPRRESSADNIRPRRGRRPPRGGGRGGRPPPRTLRDFVERPPPPHRGFPPRNRTDVQTRNRPQYTRDARQSPPWVSNTNYRDNGPMDNVVSDENRNQPPVTIPRPSEEPTVPNITNNVPPNPIPRNNENGVTIENRVPPKAVSNTDNGHLQAAPQEKRSYTRYRRSAQGPRTSPPQQHNIRKHMENLSLQPGEEAATQDRGHADGSPQHPEERHGHNRSDRPKRYSSLRQRPMPEQVRTPNMVKGVTYYNQGYRGEQFGRGGTPPVVDGPIPPHPTGPPAPPHQGMIVSDVNLPPGMAHPAMYNPAMTMAPPVPPQLLPPPFFSGGMVNYAAPPNPVSSYAPIPPAGPTAPTPNVPPVYTSPHQPAVGQVVGGVTYFNNQMPPQVLKRSPARRPNAAIPIEAPPEVKIDQREEAVQPSEA